MIHVLAILNISVRDGLGGNYGKNTIKFEILSANVFFISEPQQDQADQFFILFERQSQEIFQ